MRLVSSTVQSGLQRASRPLGLAMSWRRPVDLAGWGDLLEEFVHVAVGVEEVVVLFSGFGIGIVTGLPDVLLHALGETGEGSRYRTMWAGRRRVVRGRG